MRRRRSAISPSGTSIRKARIPVSTEVREDIVNLPGMLNGLAHTSFLRPAQSAVDTDLRLFETKRWSHWPRSGAAFGGRVRRLERPPEAYWGPQEGRFWPARAPCH